MSLASLNKRMAEVFLSVFNQCPNCGQTGKLKFICDLFSSPSNAILGIECKNCNAKAMSAIHKKAIYAPCSFEGGYENNNLPAPVNITQLNLITLEFKSDIEQWGINEEVIKEFAKFLILHFADLSVLSAPSKEIEKKI